MEDYADFITIKLQMGLNKRMYEIGQISYRIYSKANEILMSRLTACNRHDTITHSECKQLIRK